MSGRLKAVKEYLSTLNTRSMRLTRKKHTPAYTLLTKQDMGVMHALTRPDVLVNHPGYLQLGTEYHRVVGAKGYPSKIKFGWFYDLVNNPQVPVDYTQFIEPQDTDIAISAVQKHIQNIETEIKLRSSDDKPIPDALTLKLSSAKEKLKQLSSGDEKSFTIACYFTVHSPDMNKLNQLTRNVRSMLGGKMIQPQVLAFQHLSGWRSMMPSATDDVHLCRHVDTTSAALSIALPGRSRLETTEHGQILFVDRNTGLPIVFDRFHSSMMNANVIMLAGSGRGKSYLTKKDILQQIYEGRDVVIIDPKGEYAHLIDEFKGTHVVIEEGNNLAFNPFKLNTGPKDSLTSKKQELPAFFDILVGGVSDATKSALISFIDETYDACGITDARGTWKLPAPTMVEFYKVATEQIKRMPQGPTMFAAQTLLDRIRPYATGTFKSYFCGTEEIDLSDRLICYDISRVPRAVGLALMYLIMSHVHDYMTSSERGYRTLYLDEAWKVLISDSERVKEIVKTCRSFGLSLFTVTQDLDDIDSSEAGKALIGNTAVKIILGMEHAAAKSVATLVGLPKSDEQKLKTLGKGEGFMIIGGTIVEFKTPSSKSEHELITDTRPKQITEDCDLDLAPEFYRQKGLTDLQKSYLLNNGFEQATNCPTLGKGNANYYVQNKPVNQGNKHFVLTRLIAEAAENLGLDYEIHDYGHGFDVSVISSDGSIIGFEVETGSNKAIDVVAKVVRLNEACTKSKATNWYFVVPSAMERKYAEYHQDTVTRGHVVGLLSKFAGIDPGKDTE